jgi:DNA repair and recombination protein RAD52
MFNEKQTQVLQYDIDESRIKSRSKGNINLSYLEAFDIIVTANKIFGYGNWNYSITNLETVSQETNNNQNIVIAYKAVVNVTVNDLAHNKHVSREDVGFGTGIAKQLSDAHEGGAKEAVTDAIKRAMRSFGNQFGNSLYNKSRQPSHQSNQPIHLHNQHPQQEQPQIQQQNHSPQEFSSLYSLGLQVLEQGTDLVVIGEDIFNKKDSIKACGFRWDSGRKLWYRSLQEAA